MNPMVDILIAEMCQCVEQLVDPRRDRNTQYRFSDIAMAAFSVFFMQSPSFLSHQRRMAESGDSCAASLFGIARIPCDNHIRQSLDGISPESFYGVLDAALAVLQQKPGGLKSFRRLGDRCLIALDGTEFHRSAVNANLKFPFNNHSTDSASKQDSSGLAP